MGYRRRYVATTYLKTIRQAARFVELERAYLRTGDISAVTLGFLYRLEYLEPSDCSSSGRAELEA